MKGHWMLRFAAGMLGALLLVLLAGGPSEAGALAGLSGHGVGAAAGLLWIIVFPLVVLMVPPLLFTGALEALQGFRVSRAPSLRDPGLGSRSAPGRQSSQ